MENYILNADNFKRWMKNHSDEENGSSDMMGTEVQARYGSKKTMKNMCVENGKPGKVIREFMDEGGVVKEVSGEEYLIRVKSGEFTINKKFVIS